MIVTLTLNPAIDKSTEVIQLISEKKMRCSQMTVQPGGGGINISRAISELQGKSTAIFLYGGANGQLLLRLLKDDHINSMPVQIKDEIRESIVVKETSTKKEFRFIMPGPFIDFAEQELIKQTIKNLVGVNFLICSGSLPPGISPGFLGEIALIAKEKGVKLVVDTSGEPLRMALKYGVYMIKPNLSELCFLVNKKYLPLTQIDEAVDQVLSEGQCEILVVSMGAAGAIVATKSFRKKFNAPVVKKQTTVGAGDSMVAGIVYGIENGYLLEDAVRLGIACGTAATVKNGTALFSRKDAVEFFDWMKTE